MLPALRNACVGLRSRGSSILSVRGVSVDAQLLAQRMRWTCRQILSALHLWIKALPGGGCTARDRSEGLQPGPARGEAPRGCQGSLARGRVCLCPAGAAFCSSIPRECAELAWFSRPSLKFSVGQGLGPGNRGISAGNKSTWQAALCL